MRIDASGRLLVGTSTAVSNYQIKGGSGWSNSIGQTPTVQIAGTGSNFNTGLAINKYNSTGYGAVLSLGLSLSNTLGTNTLVTNNTGPIGVISFNGNDGTNFIPAAQICCEPDGTTGTNDMPGRLIFFTTADGASSPTERMRIASDGMTTINTPGNWNLRLQRPSGAAQGNLAFDNGGTQVGSVVTSTTSTTYNTSSDYRLKENVVPLDNAINRINQIPVHRFNFIADPGKIVDGFLAHEAQVVVPECVTGVKDEVDGNGDPVYQGIDQSKLVPLLTAALQEAIGEIESLKARVAALESA